MASSLSGIFEIMVAASVPCTIGRSNGMAMRQGIMKEDGWGASAARQGACHGLRTLDGESRVQHDLRSG